MITNKINIPKRLLETILKRIGSYGTLQHYRTVRMKILKTKMRIDFLEKCYCFGLIPNFLRFKIPTNGVFKEEAVKNFQRRLLKLELQNARKHVEVLNEKLMTYRTKVQTDIPEVLWASIINVIHVEHIRMTLQLEDKYKRKLVGLSEHQDRPINENYKNVLILDDDIKIPKFFMKCLSLGPKHPVVGKFNNNDVLTEIDCLLEHIEPKMIIDDNGKNIEEATKNLIEVEAHKYSKIMSQKKVDTNFVRTIKFLKANQLRAVPCDKTNAFMIMKELSYHERMQNILDGSEFIKYAKPRRNAINPILKRENEINDQLLNMMKRGDLSEELYKELHHTGSTVPRL